MATVCVSVLFGITTSFDPGGTRALPDSATTAASEQGGTTILNALCCLGITTVLTPGLCSAAETGSVLDELPELPQADSTAVAAASMTAAGTTRGAANLALLIFSSRWPLWTAPTHAPQSPNEKAQAISKSLLQNSEGRLESPLRAAANISARRHHSPTTPPYLESASHERRRSRRTSGA
jgi:hypothetical protein